MKILLILPTLEFGGAEKVFSFLARNLDPGIFQVRLLVIGSQERAMLSYNKDNTIFLNKTRVLKGFPGVIGYIRKFKPDIVIGTIIHLNIAMGMLSFFFKKTKFIGRESSVHSTMNQFSTRKPPFSDYLVRFFYRRLHGLICQSQDMKDDLIANFGLREDRLKLINNPITELPAELFPKNRSEKLRFITIGRLSAEKGYFRTMEVLGSLNYPFEYTIIGDGPDKQKLFQYAKELHIFDCIKYIPFTNDTRGFLEKSDFFLQGSYVEGFPNAVLESCTFGVPVIAFNAPGGTREIIENGTNGFFVDSIPGMIQLLNDAGKLRSLNRSFVSTFTISKFHPEKLLKQYEDYLSGICNDI